MIAADQKIDPVISVVSGLRHLCLSHLGKEFQSMLKELKDIIKHKEKSKPTKVRKVGEDLDKLAKKIRKLSELAGGPRAEIKKALATFDNAILWLRDPPDESPLILAARKRYVKIYVPLKQSLKDLDMAAAEYRIAILQLRVKVIEAAKIINKWAATCENPGFVYKKTVGSLPTVTKALSDLEKPMKPAWDKWSKALRAVIDVKVDLTNLLKFAKDKKINTKELYYPEAYKFYENVVKVMLACDKAMGDNMKFVKSM